MSQPMRFQITCDDCGYTRPIVPENAGENLFCPCGQVLKVPKLSELRRIAGQSAAVLDIANRLPTMYLDKQLPPDTHCVGCRTKTGETLECWVECERAHGAPARIATTLFGCFLFAFWPLLGLYYLVVRSNKESKPIGNDLVVRIPLPLCETCRKATSRKEANIRRLLQSVELYQQLLDQYPGSRVGAS